MHTFYLHPPIKLNRRPFMKLVRWIGFLYICCVVSLYQTKIVMHFKVLGAGGNTFNEIRRKRQKDPMKTVRMKNFLSPIDIMPLTIRILKSGNISVAITGQPPFITAQDANVLDIKYLSFSYVF